MNKIQYRRIFQPFNNNGGGGGGTTINVVSNYSALPSAASVSGEFYWCSNSEGTAWLPGSLGGTYYNKGTYYSNGSTWEYIDTPYQATQTEVNTGTNTDKFVTPATLTNWSGLGSYVPYTGATTNVDLGTNTISSGTAYIKNNATNYLTISSSSIGLTTYLSTTSVASGGDHLFKNSTGTAAVRLGHLPGFVNDSTMHIGATASNSPTYGNHLFYGDSASNVYVNSTTLLGFTINTSQKIRVTTTGVSVNTSNNPLVSLHVFGTSEQFRIAYDLSNYYSTTVSSAGLVTFDATGSGAGFKFNDSITLPYVAKTANYTITTNDYTIDCTANSFTVTLPTAIGISGRIFNIINSGSGTITVATTSSQTIGNYLPTTTITLAPGEVRNLQSDNANWKLYA